MAVVDLIVAAIDLYPLARRLAVVQRRESAVCQADVFGALVAAATELDGVVGGRAGVCFFKVQPGDHPPLAAGSQL